MKKKADKQISFTTYEKTCEFHDATDQRLCYCTKISSSNSIKLCNKFNCPKYNEPKENNERKTKE